MRHRNLVFLATFIAALGIVSYVSGRLTAPTVPPTETAEGVLADAVRAIASGKRSSPIVGEQPRRGLPTLTFVARAVNMVPPRIVSDATGWGERADGTFDTTVGTMSKVPGTDWYALSLKVEPYARIEYLIAYGPGDYRIDPYNERQVQRSGGPASEVVMAGYQPPQEFVDPPVTPAGTVTEALVPSRAIGAPRRVIVYMPPHYDAKRVYKLVVFHDGDLVVNTGQAPRVLDWLIAHDAIEPVVAAFVDPVSRTDDFKRGAPMRTFVTSELLEFLPSRVNVTAHASERAIVGVSAGARGALDAVLATSAYQRLGLMIPALDARDLDAITTWKPVPLRVSIVAAHYDRPNMDAARGAQLALAEHERNVFFKEVPEGHSTATWRTHLRDVLIDLFGTQTKR